MRSPRAAPSWFAAAVALVSTGAARAQDLSNLSGYLTLSSGYWKHGLSQVDGAALQLGLDYQHYTGFFAYARVMNVDYPQDLPGQTRDVEVSAYLGYHGRGDLWSWTMSVGRYGYPDTDGYDYDEWSASVGFRDRVFYTASYNPEYYTAGSSALNQEVSVAFPLPGNFEVGGAVGYFDVGGGPQLTHWNVGASKLVGRIAIDLRYYDGSDSNDGNDSADGYGIHYGSDSHYGYSDYLGASDGSNYVLSFSYALKRKQSRAR